MRKKIFQYKENYFRKGVNLINTEKTKVVFYCLQKCYKNIKFILQTIHFVEKKQ